MNGMVKIRAIVEFYVPSWTLQGVKEDFAMYCERYRDGRLVAFEELRSKEYEQMRIGGENRGKQ